MKWTLLEILYILCTSYKRTIIVIIFVDIFVDFNIEIYAY